MKAITKVRRYYKDQLLTEGETFEISDEDAAKVRAQIKENERLEKLTPDERAAEIKANKNVNPRPITIELIEPKAPTKEAPKGGKDDGKPIV